MVEIRDVVFDSRHAASLARFWAQALDGYAVAAYDDEELERLSVRCRSTVDAESLGQLHERRPVPI